MMRYISNYGQRVAFEPCPWCGHTPDVIRDADQIVLPSGATRRGEAYYSLLIRCDRSCDLREEHQALGDARYSSVTEAASVWHAALYKELKASGRDTE